MCDTLKRGLRIDAEAIMVDHHVCMQHPELRGLKQPTHKTAAVDGGYRRQGTDAGDSGWRRGLRVAYYAKKRR
jgi:hypothetical protein